MRKKHFILVYFPGQFLNAQCKLKRNSKLTSTKSCRMRTIWKDILTMINTACIAGVIFYCYCADYNGSVILGLGTFVAVMIVYLLCLTIWKRGQRRN